MENESVHYCQEHQCTFKRYEKNNNVWYAHKNEDGSYCNEAKKKEQPKEELTSSISTEERQYQPFKADPEKQASIELQHYTDNVKDLWIAGKLTDKSPLVEKYLFILSSKIGIDPKTVTPEPKLTTAGGGSTAGFTPIPAVQPASKTTPDATQSKSEPSKPQQPVPVQVEKTYSITHITDIIKALGAKKLPGWDRDSVLLSLKSNYGSKGVTVTENIKSLTPEAFEKYDKAIKGYEKLLQEPQPGDGIF